MRRINRKNSTKSERIFYEILKELKIDFKHRWIIAGREVDFVIGNLAIEIDGHKQDVDKNELIVKAGYVPIHFENKEILEDRLKIKQLINTYVNNIF